MSNAENQINKPVINKPEVVKETPNVTNTIVGFKPSAEVAENKTPLLPADRVPANWNLTESDQEGIVHAENVQTGRVFAGTPKEFSKYIKG